MNAQNTERQSRIFLSAKTLMMATAFFIANVAVDANAQTSQYKRVKKSVATDPVNPTAVSPPADKNAVPVAIPANGAQLPTAVDPNAKPSDKVDVSDLENRYWESKDTEFHVVQNRQYTKAKRVSISLQYGPVVNSTYVSGNQIGFTSNYYLSERIGIQAQYVAPQVSPNALVNNFASQNGVATNYNMLKGYYGVGFNYIPFYAKMSVLEKKILYFDMAITPNIGMTQYQQQTFDSSGQSQSAFTYGIDISQHFFLNKTFAIRWDLLNRFYTENVVKYYKTGNDPGSQAATSTTFLIGIQVFF